MKILLYVSLLLFANLLFANDSIDDSMKLKSIKSNEEISIDTSDQNKNSFEASSNNQSNRSKSDTGKKDKNKTEKETDWNSIVAAIVGALFGGLIGWGREIYYFINGSRITGKILSQYHNIAGADLVFLQKISIFSQNLDFYLKDIKIFVKYDGDEEIECTNMVWRNLKFTFIINEQSSLKTLEISQVKYIQHQSIFPKNTSIVGFISFKVNPYKDERFEYVKYIFEDFKENKKELIIKRKDINDNTLHFDDNLWV